MKIEYLRETVTSGALNELLRLRGENGWKMCGFVYVPPDGCVTGFFVVIFMKESQTLQPYQVAT